MQSKETFISELINLLKIVEPTLKNEDKTVMLVNSSVSKKGSKNIKTTKKPMKEKGGVTKKKVKKTTPKGTCFHCGQDGHWRRNCKAYLGSLKKKALDAPSTLVCLSLRLILFLIIINGYWILVMVLTYALICKD